MKSRTTVFGVPKNRQTSRIIAAVTALIMLMSVVLTGIAMPLAAFAEGGDTEKAEYLAIDKTVSKTKLVPGDEFTYTIAVTCSQADCINTQISDQLPKELVGFAVVALDTNPSTTPRDVRWVIDGSSQESTPTALTSDTQLQVFPKAPLTLNPGEVGLGFGTTISINLTLKVPGDYPPGNSGTITNTAVTSADNALEVSSDADIVIDSPVIIDGVASKSWDPASQTFSPGVTSTVSVGLKNTSNVAVDTMVLQDPSTPLTASDDLNPANPFYTVDFVGLKDVVVPAGAKSVQVDVLALNDENEWIWVEGVPNTSLDAVLPGGLPQDVQIAGTRVTVVGEFAPGAELKQDFEVAQRATDRGEKALDAVETTVKNDAAGTVSLEDKSKDSTANATLEISPAKATVEVTKAFTPKEIVAGDKSAVAITAKNGKEPVKTLTVAERSGFFTEDITFAGWAEAPTWPEGATSAKITYFDLDGEALLSVSFDDGLKPSEPSAPISGFEITFEGDIAADGQTDLNFDVQTTEKLDQETREWPNKVVAEVKPEFGLGSTDEAADKLKIITPGVNVDLNKTVRPDTAVRPGQSVGVELEAVASKTTSSTKLNTIVIEDKLGNGTEDPEFWNAFDLKAIAPTQIPAQTDFTIEVLVEGVWTQLATKSTTESAEIFALNRAEFAAALVAIGGGDVTGVRFTFNSTNEAGYPATVTVRPALVFEARSTLRSGQTPEEGTHTFKNAAVSVVTGESPNKKPLEDDDGDTKNGQITWPPAGPGEGLGIDKDWNKDQVSALTSETAGTKLRWHLDRGFETVVISDTADHQKDTSKTVFDAFNLTRIAPVPASPTAFTNGWFMKYDTVTNVIVYELVEGQVEEREITAPDGSWTSADGGFKGYQLTADEQESVIGIDVVLKENTPARENAQSVDPLDPFAPKPGEGVLSNGLNREFDLTWQLRDKTRSSEATWVTSKTELNKGAGTVENTTRITGTDGVTSVSDTDADTILIVDYPPLVKVAKDVDIKTAILTPQVGAPETSYATPQWTIKANNDAVTRASFVRVTDPLTCDGGLNTTACETAHTEAGAKDDPFTSVTVLDAEAALAWVKDTMFEQFTATGVTISASDSDQVDLAQSVAWVLSYDPATKQLSSTQTTAAKINDKSASINWDQVVGISVTFQDTDGAPSIDKVNDLIIKVDTVVNSHLRTDATKPLVLKAIDTDFPVKNEVFAQSYTPILGEKGANGAVAETEVTLTGGTLEVTASKKISPTEIARPNKDTPVTVTLGGTGGKSTLSPEQVVIEDYKNSAEFWNHFDFTGLGSISKPAGADLVQVDVFGPFGPNQDPVWKTGSKVSVAEVPVDAADYSKIEGIRFTFTKTGGGLFIPSPEVGTWSTQVNFTAKLRNQVRGTSDPVLFEGEHSNEQTITSSRVDQKPVDASATAKITLTEGTQNLSVEKIANNGTHLVGVGVPVPFDLVFQNTGTGYLTIDQVTDQLPKELVWTGAAPSYVTSADGTLATEGITHSLGTDGNLVFTWPTDANIMQPGEKFTITLELELQPLRQDQDSATNTMVVQTNEKLQSCGHLSNPGKLTSDWEQNEDKNTCGAFDHVQPKPGANLFVVKGVRHLTQEGEYTGAYRNGFPESECALPNLSTSRDGFFRSPCITHSEINGVDDWVLFTQNAGTVPVTEMVIFDQLPVAGDQYLIGTAKRGSNFRPQLTGMPEFVASNDKVKFITEVTSDANVCAGTWTSLENAEACGDSDWETADESTDWSKVSGLRVTADFSQTTGKELAPGEAIEVHYSSKNVISSEQDESGSSRVIPVDNQLAINQFGVQFKYSTTAAGRFQKIAPNIVGVDLPTGSLEINKVIDGEAKEHAPESFKANVACTHGETELDMGDLAQVELDKENNFTARIDGIPLGAECVITEDGEDGSYGETSRAIENATIKIDVPNAVGTPVENQDVPANQITTLTNTYEYGGLNLTKVVDTAATVGTFGPFDFDLSCTHLDKTVFEDQITLSKDLGWDYQVADKKLPIGSVCVLEETETGNADLITIEGLEAVLDPAGEPIPGKGSVKITEQEQATEVTVTNSFNAGTLSITKSLDGEGSDRFGNGTFTASAACVYNDENVYIGEVTFKAGETKTFQQDGADVVLPNGTLCDIAETQMGGANENEFPAQIKIEGGSDVTTVVDNEFDIVNIFNVGNLAIQKVETGQGAERFGGSDYQVRLECVYDVDGVETPVLWDDQPFKLITLTKEGNYSHLETGIIEGAKCDLTEETLNGGSNGQDLGDTVTIVANGQTEEPVEVTVTNTFNVGEVAINKVEAGAGAKRFGGSDYQVRLECVYDVDGVKTPVLWDDQPFKDILLTKDNDYRHVEQGILEGASCAITEENLTGGSTGQDLGEPVLVVDGEDSAQITVTNTFDVGAIEVNKAIAGAGAAKYGNQEFAVRLACEYLVDGEKRNIEWDNSPWLDIKLNPANDFRVVVEDLAVGAKCAITEEFITGGAHEIDLGETVVVASGQAESEQASTPLPVLTVTNTFLTGELEIHKVLDGQGAASAQDKKFTVRLECVYEADSQKTKVTWDGKEYLDVDLNQGNNFSAQIDQIMLGATCAVIDEPKNGGAIKIDLGEPVLVDGKTVTAPVITVTNTFKLLEQTGTNAALPAALALVLLAGGAVLLRKPRRGGRHTA